MVFLGRPKSILARQIGPSILVRFRTEIPEIRFFLRCLVQKSHPFRSDFLKKRGNPLFSYVISKNYVSKNCFWRCLNSFWARLCARGFRFMGPNPAPLFLCTPLRCPRDGREQDLGWKPRRPLCHRIADGHSVRLLVVYVDSIQGQSYALNVFGISPAKYSHSKQMYVLLLLGNKRKHLAWRRKRILTHV